MENFSLLLLLSLLLVITLAVDRSKFRTCESSSFCNRHRNKEFTSHYSVDPTSVTIKADEGTLEGVLTGGPSDAVPLAFKVMTYTVGVARLRITEKTPIHGGRWQPVDVVLDDTLSLSSFRVDSQSTSAITVSYGDSGEAVKSFTLQFHPFQFTMAVGGRPAISVNSRNMFHFEGHRVKQAPTGIAAAAAAGAGADTPAVEKKEIVDWGEDGKAIYADGTTGDEVKPDADNNADADKENLSERWEETFNGHTDSRPFGPAAVSMDVNFPGSSHLYGIPEHASSHLLKATTGAGAAYSQPYRMYTLDVFEYELDEAMALYGTIPIMLAHTTEHTVGAFWFNPSETFVDVSYGAGEGQSHWMSESGIVDLMLLPGPTPGHVWRQVMKLTGRPQLPPLFSLGYHQCRWNYRDEADVDAVEENFEQHNFPYDVLWLDIEHTDGKRYFTWDRALFPTPAAMQQRLAQHGRKMVTIVDPHIKRDGSYRVHQEAEQKGLYIKNKDGGDFDGWCWPGSSSYVDFTDPKAREWWASQFSLDNYAGSSNSLYTWNDMNEPSVFNGPEVTMQKDCKSLAGVEHREWHNLYGFYMQMATNEGQIARHPNRQERPFLLSRSFFAGSQRYGAIWTGDNAAKWDHLRASIPMLLSVGVAGLPFAGADVGGFFGNPSAELMTRWMQVGAYQPFFRGHAHHDSKRREPWTFGEPTTGHLRDAALARYQLLPYWYTLFATAHATGAPAMRPLWSEFPSDAALFNVDTEFMAGPSLLVAPVLHEGHTSVQALLPAGVWYDLSSHMAHQGDASRTVHVSAPIDVIPVFQRGGSIVPRQMRVRRSSALMANDPYTLVVALDLQGQASGQLYMDDGHTFAHQSGLFRRRTLSMVGGVLSSSPSAALTHGGLGADSDDLKVAGPGDKRFAPANTVERIVVLGMPSQPSSVTVTAEAGAGSVGRQLTFTYDAATQRLVVRKPDVKVAMDWQISFQ